MTGPPTPTAQPIALVAVGALLLLALGGVAFGALTGGRAAGPTASSMASPTASPSPTPAVVAGGSAWPAETSTPVPTATPVPPTPTPVPTATPPAVVDASLDVCRDQRDGRCVDEIERMGDEPFVVILTFDDSAAGDTFVFRLDGPGDRVVNGGSIEVGGGAGRAWSTFRGGLAEGKWSAVVTRGGEEIARTDFRVR